MAITLESMLNEKILVVRANKQIAKHSALCKCYLHQCVATCKFILKKTLAGYGPFTSTTTQYYQSN